MTVTGSTWDFSDYRAQKRLPVLDGVRAVSVLLVFTAHQSYPAFWAGLHGSAGVTIFFVLSGYLITTLAVREETERGRLDIVGFYLRRTFRIYPLFFAVLGLYMVLILVAGQQPQRRGIFTDNIPYFLLGFPEHAILDPAVEVPFSLAWSLGVEEKFYLLWPLIGFVVLAGTFGRRLTFLLATAVVAVVVGVFWGRAFAGYAHIAFGCIAAILLHQPTWYARLRRLGHPAVLVTLTAAAAVLQFGTAAILKPTELYVPYGLLIAVLLCGIVAARGRAVEWLASRPMVFLGRVSFAFYLLHGFAVKAAEAVVPDRWGFGGSVVAAALGLVLATVIAWVAYRLVERPAIRAGHRLARSRSGRGNDGDGAAGSAVGQRPVVDVQDAAAGRVSGG